MAKYNSQKHSKGRTSNRNIKVDREENKTYLIDSFDGYSFYIDSIFDTVSRNEDKPVKTIYISINDIRTPILYIDESVNLDCDFMEVLRKNYKIVLEKVILEDCSDDSYKKLSTKINNSPGYHSESESLEELKDYKGFYVFPGIFELYKRFNKDWTISGHSCSLYEKGIEAINLDKLVEMNSIEFCHYFSQLHSD